MLSDVSAIQILDNVGIPEGLQVVVTDDSNDFLNLKGQLNSATVQYFGIAYRQGNRLHFATAMAVRDYLNVAHVDHAPKGATLGEMKERHNRPTERAHGKAINEYLNETACQGLPFIFPSFLLNYGIGYTEGSPRGLLVIFAGSRDSLAWPAVFTPPLGWKLPVTDGGHRTDEISKKLVEQAGQLPANALSVIFVMEDDEDAYHQDFADCAKAKAISKSLSGSWDRRDSAKRFGVELVEGNQYLRKLIDATSNSVNLSTNSTKAWSMSALQSAIMGIYAGESGTKQLSSYIDQLFQKVPMLIDLANGTSPAKHRNVGRGGCVLLRGVGFAVLMQGYSHCLKEGMPFTKMAETMAKVDWYVLKEGSPAQNGQDAHSYTKAYAQPIWLNMLAMLAGATAFRIKGHKEAAETSFQLIGKDHKLPGINA